MPLNAESIVDFKTLFVGVRPPRIAILVNVSDTDWQETCLRIIEFFTTVWGGKHSLIVPSTGKSIDGVFWEILEAFDPDYLFYYHKTLEDLSITKPEEYKKILSQQVDQAISKFPGPDVEYTRAQIDEQLRRVLVDDFSISPELQDELKRRIAPLYLENEIVQLDWIGASGQARYPLTSVEKLLGSCEHPAEVLEIDSTLPDISPLWYSATLGRLHPSYSQQISSAGIRVIRKTFDQGDASGLFDLVVGGRSEGVSPFDLSMLQLKGYTRRGFHDWKEPVVVVVGSAFKDFCLYQGLSRVRNRVAWLPTNWIDSFRSGLARRKAGGEGLGGHEMYAYHFVHDIWQLATSRGSKRQTVFVSASLQPPQIEDYRIGLNEAGLSVSGVMQEPSKVWSSISPLLEFPTIVYEDGNAGKLKTALFRGNEIAGFFETPKPERFKQIDPYEHRWMAEFSVNGHALPRHPLFGDFVVRSPAITTHEARIGSNGTAYFCPNLLVSSGDIDQVLVKPGVFLPDALDIAKHVGRHRNLSCKISDKGNFLAETIKKFGGLDGLGAFLTNHEKRAVLDKFLDTRGQTAGVIDEGVYLNSDRRRYVNFEAVQKILARTERETCDFIDDLLLRQVFHRGFIFKCSFCRNADWFSIDDLTHQFTCKRCGRTQVYLAEHSRSSREPSWFYKLDEIVYQGHSNNMSVPALALHYLHRRNAASFLYAPELEFADSISNKPAFELDIFCIDNGVLCIGEAKKEDVLGENAASDLKLSAKYLKIAEQFCASKVIFATIAPSWSTRTCEKIDEAFRESAVSYVLLSGSQIL
jgi:hypothetical protein